MERRAGEGEEVQEDVGEVEGGASEAEDVAGAFDCVDFDISWGQRTIDPRGRRHVLATSWLRLKGRLLKGAELIMQGKQSVARRLGRRNRLCDRGTRRARRGGTSCLVHLRTLGTSPGLSSSNGSNPGDRRRQ